MQFYQLAKGARFESQGKQFTKTAMSMARGEDGTGTIFPADSEVAPIGEPLMLPDEVAAQWKPPEAPWWSHMSPAPGQKQE